MITKYERTILDLCSAIAAQIINGEKLKRRGQRTSGNEENDRGADLRLLRDDRAPIARNRSGSLRAVR